MMQLRRTLTQAGLKVLGVAGNGEAGVAAVLRERPDVVIMDIKMPVMNGIEAARRIMESYNVCIVILTAFSTEEYQEQARKIGVCGYVFKPISADTLLPQLEAAYQKFVQSAPGDGEDYKRG